jgi:hypothetical protein
VRNWTKATLLENRIEEERITPKALLRNNEGNKGKETFAWWGNEQSLHGHNGGPQISVSPVALSGRDQRVEHVPNLKMKRV